MAVSSVQRCSITRRLLIVIVTALLVSTVSSQRVNFTMCYYEKVKSLNTSDLSDKRQSFLYDITGTKRLEADKPYLSLLGCAELCGHSDPMAEQIWSASEIGGRFIAFIIPVIVLAGRFSYSAAGLKNAIFTFIHLIGDPIDSSWSLLTRQEVARRNWILAVEWWSQNPKHVATVFTVFDQWLQDPLKHLSTKPGHDTPQSPGTRQHDPLNSPFLFKLPEEGTKARTRVLGYIKEASRKIGTLNSNTLVSSWLLVIWFGGALAGAFVRTATQETNNQTAHTIAVVMLFSFLVFAVIVRGHTGDFKHREHVLWEMMKLQRDTGNLLPEIDDKAAELYVDGKPYSGVIKSFRPVKTLKFIGKRQHRSEWLLFGISLASVFIGCAAAFCLSWFTPSQGFGCRAAAWLCIFLVWCSSCGLTAWFGRLSNGDVKKHWYMTIVKDFLCMSFVVILVGFAQAGMMNNCYCRASVTFQPHKRGVIDIGPVDQKQRRDSLFLWITTPLLGMALIGVCCFVAGLQGENARMLFERSSEEAAAELRALMNDVERCGGSEGGGRDDPNISGDERSRLICPDTNPAYPLKTLPSDGTRSESTRDS